MWVGSYCTSRHSTNLKLGAISRAKSHLLFSSEPFDGIHDHGDREIYAHCNRQPFAEREHYCSVALVSKSSIGMFWVSNALPGSQWHRNAGRLRMTDLIPTKKWSAACRAGLFS